MAILEVKDLTKSFPRQSEKIVAVDHVTFSIESGECLGLIGESGCGKSTTAELIARLQREDSGKVIWKGEDLTARRTLRPAKGVSMIFQNAQDSFDPRDTVLQGIEQGARHGDADRKEDARNLMRFVGLREDYAKRRFSELSGGECQRAAIARALISRPDLLISDEATSALDVLVQAEIMELLKRAKETGTSILFITHDLPLASQICDHIAVMDHGEIVEYSETARILHEPKAKETRTLIDSILDI